MPKRETNWVRFSELKVIAEEAMLEQTYCIETRKMLEPEQIEKFFRAFDPEVVHNLMELVTGMADLLCGYRGSHIGCDVIDGKDSRCELCRKLESGTLAGGARVAVERVRGKDVERT
jgi:hypothetical protein